MIGQRIKQLREERDLNQIELAKKLNISNTTLSQYETGNRVPSDDIKVKIATLFNCSLDYLMGYSDIRTSALKDTSKIDSLEIPERFDTVEEALRFILKQPAFMTYGISEMSEEEIMDIAENMLFGLKISLEKHKQNKGE